MNNMKYYKNSNGDYFSYNYDPQFAENADMTEITKTAYNKGVAAILQKLEEEAAAQIDDGAEET